MKNPIQNKKNDHQHDSHNHGKDVQATKNMKVVFFINLIFSISEFFFGVIFNSVAILSDAVHDLGDSVSVGLAWFFQHYSNKENTEKFSFGYQRFSLVGALITAAILISGSIVVSFRSIPLLLNPEPVNATGMFWLSLVAIGLNGYAAWRLSKGTSKNETMLNLHMLEDVLGWVGVFIVSIVMQFTDFYILDPILSVSIAIYILIKTLPQLYGTLMIFLEGVPEGVEVKAIEANIMAIQEVKDFSHFHIWSIDGEENAFSVTILLSPEDYPHADRIKKEIREQIKDLNVTHSTIEIVTDEKDLQK